MGTVYTGEVRNGVVVFDGESVPFAEGTKVRVRPLVNGDEASRPEDPAARTRGWLTALAEKVDGLAVDLPSDLAENHDHYAHGKPKS